MKHLFSSTLLFILIACLSLTQMLGCSNNPTSPDEDNDQVNQTVQKVGTNGVEIYGTVSSFKQISDLIRGPGAIVDLDVPGFDSPGAAMRFAKSITQTSFENARKSEKGLVTSERVAADSVIWDVTYRNELLGITYRSRLVYDSATGEAHLFLVGFEYRENHPLQYDSTAIAANLGPTLGDDSDDVLLSVLNLKRFKPGRLLQEQIGRFVPDPYPAGTEPTGGLLTNDVTYASSSFLASTHAELAYHEGSGGSYAKVVHFSDGSSHSESVTFNENGTGTFEETRRDGTKIQGTFDSAEKDGQGGFSKTITFPPGHNPVSISESGEFTIHPADSTLDGSYEKEILFRDNSTRSERVTVHQTRTAAVLTTTITVESTSGGSGVITLIESQDVDQISGEWTNPDQTFLVFSAEYYPDGSAHLKFELYASEEAFENGADPIASGEFNFFPGGSGQGTVTESGQTHQVTIDPDGSVKASNGSGHTTKPHPEIH